MCLFVHSKLCAAANKRFFRKHDNLVEMARQQVHEEERTMCSSGFACQRGLRRNMLGAASVCAALHGLLGNVSVYLATGSGGSVMGAPPTMLPLWGRRWGCRSSCSRESLLPLPLLLRCGATVAAVACMAALAAIDGQSRPSTYTNSESFCPQ